MDLAVFRVGEILWGDLLFRRPKELVDEGVEGMDGLEAVGDEGSGGVRGLLRPKEFVGEGVRRDELESVGDEGGSGVCGGVGVAGRREGRITFRAPH